MSEGRSRIRFVRRAAIALVVLCSGWLVALLVIGATTGAERGEVLARELAVALGAQGTVGTSELALIRGRFAIERVEIRRDDSVGLLALAIEEVVCDLPPLGLALVDQRCRALVLSGFSLDVSSLEMLRVKRLAVAPLTTERFELRQARLRFPWALEREPVIEVEVAHASAGATVMRTPLSWLFALDALRARATTPLGAIEIAVDAGTATLSGGPFTPPLALALDFPAQVVDEDPRAELARISTWTQAFSQRAIAALLARKTGR